MPCGRGEFLLQWFERSRPMMDCGPDGVDPMGKEKKKRKESSPTLRPGILDNPGAAELLQQTNS